jgi:hypothetical protein
MSGKKLQLLIVLAVFSFLSWIRPASAAIYFQDDLETGGWAPWNNGAGWNQISVEGTSVMNGVTTPTLRGAYSGQAALSSGAKRCERCKFNAGDLQTLEDRWYGFAIFVPSDFTQPSTQQFVIVEQIRSNADTIGGVTEPDQSPFISLEIRDSATRWVMYNRWDDQAISTGLTNGAGGSITTTKVLDQPLQKGVWTRFVYHAKWDYRDPANGPCVGILQVWMDDGNGYQLVTDRQNLPNCYNNVGDAGFKCGFYNPALYTGAKTLYYDDIKISQANNSYFDEVAPLSSAPITQVAESFDYPIGSLNGQNGGLGWGGAWSTAGGSGAADVVTGSLGYSLLPSSGNRANLYDTDGTAQTATRTLSHALGTASSTVWIAFLARKAQPYREAKITLGGLTVRCYNKENWKIKTTNSTEATFTGATYSATHLFLIRIEFGATDQVYAWYDPNLANGAPDISTAQCSLTDTGLLIDQVQLRHGTLGTSAEYSQWDEIRMGNSFEAVTQ